MVEASEPESGNNGAEPASNSAAVHQARQNMQAQIAHVTLIMMATSRYRHMSLADLDWMVMAPMIRNQVLFATGKPNTEAESKNDEDVPATTIGFAIWARVSEEVDAKIKEQISAKVFPVRLRPDEWNSGEIVWLLDVVTPNKVVATRLIHDLSKSGIGKGSLRAHPIVVQQADRDALEKLGVKTNEEAQAS